MTHIFTTLPPGGDFDSYEPKAPANVRYTYAEKSECVDEYKIGYRLMDNTDDSGKDEYEYQEGSGAGSEETIKTNSITLPMLQPCSRYSVEINTHFNEKESSYLDSEFIVPPQADSGKYIIDNLDTDIQDQRISMSLDILGAKLQCITQYELTMCKHSD